MKFVTDKIRKKFCDNDATRSKAICLLISMKSKLTSKATHTVYKYSTHTRTHQKSKYVFCFDLQGVQKTKFVYCRRSAIIIADGTRQQ